MSFFKSFFFFNEDFLQICMILKQLACFSVALDKSV